MLGESKCNKIVFNRLLSDILPLLLAIEHLIVLMQTLINITKYYHMPKCKTSVSTVFNYRNAVLTNSIHKLKYHFRGIITLGIVGISNLPNAKLPTNFADL